MNTKYIVVNAVSGPSSSPFVHSTLQDAQMEAARLCRENPNVKFYVLKVLGYYLHRDAVWSGEGPDESLKSAADCLRGRSWGWTSNGSLDEEIPF